MGEITLAPAFRQSLRRAIGGEGNASISPLAGEKALSCIRERACTRASAWQTQERGPFNFGESEAETTICTQKHSLLLTSRCPAAEGVRADIGSFDGNLPAFVAIAHGINWPPFTSMTCPVM
jgi:hypothetical protein